MPRIAQRVFAILFMGVVPAACSTHPLPEDVTGLPISQIVHQIQCEAAREVKGWHAHLGYTQTSRELAEINTNITGLQTAYDTAVEKLQKGSDFGVTRVELEDAFDGINLQIDQVQQKIRRLQREVATPGNQDQLATLKNEALQLYRQYQLIVAAAGLYATAAEAGDQLEKEKKKLTAKGDKERFNAVRLFEKNNAAFQFTFQATEENNASAEGAITWPITPGVITLGYDVGDKRKRASDRQVKLAATFRELVLLPCDGVTPPVETRFPRMYPITGAIGLDEVIWEYMVITHRINKSQSASFQSGGAGDSYRDKITFTTTINGGLNPGINLSKRMGQLIEVSADLKASRVDNHELTIFLTPPGTAAGTAAPTEIIIKNMPAVRVRARHLEQSPAG